MLIPDDDSRNSYQKLLSELYRAKFKYFVGNDVNRASDGERLRIIFEDETKLWCNNYYACSVLEMLGALALRWENDIMYDPDEGDRTSVWFWEMICNMGLDALDDWHFDQDEFDEIIEKLNSHTYDKDGFGGPFYIAGTNIDMRKTELWYQLNYYIRSKFE